MYTQHAKQQMIKRSVSHQQVLKALCNGNVLINKHDPKKRVIIDNQQGLYLVTNESKTIIITVFWK